MRASAVDLREVEDDRGRPEVRQMLADGAVPQQPMNQVSVFKEVF